MATKNAMLDDALLGAINKLITNPGDAIAQQLTSKVNDEAAWRKLALAVGDLPNEDKPEISLPLLRRNAQQQGQVGTQWQWSAEVGADASVAIDLQSDEQVQALGLTLADGHKLLAYEATLGLNGKLGADGKAGVWTIGLAASAGTSGTLRWYAQAENKMRVIEALGAATQGVFFMPYDLAAMLNAAGGTEWCGLAMSVQGQAQASASVSAGQSFSGWTFGLDGSKVKLGMSLGVNADVALTREGQFDLHVIPQRVPGGSGFGLRVKLEESKRRESTLAISANAGIDLSALAANAEQVLRQAWPEAKHPLLDALTKPGTTVLKKLQTAINKNLDGDLADLATLLIGGNTQGALRDSIVAKLTGSLTDRLDGALGSIADGTATAEALVSQWIDGLLGTNAATQQLRDKLKTQARATVDGALSDATQGLTDAISKLSKELKDGAANGADALLDPLGELGAKLKKALTKLDGNKASTEIKAALKAYSDARNKLLAPLADAQRAKLALSFAAARQDTRRSGALVELFFLPGPMKPEAERLYHALCAGRLLMVDQLIAAAKEAGAIDGSASGWVLEGHRIAAQQSVTLSFFGRDFVSSATQVSELTMQADIVSGQLLVADGSASAQSAIANFWLNRTAELSVQLHASRQGDVAIIHGEVLGAFTAKDQVSDEASVQSILDLWAESMRTRNRIRVGEALGAPTGSGAKAFWRNLNFAVPVNTSADEWQRLLGTPAAAIDNISLKHVLRCAGLALDATNAVPVGDTLESLLRGLAKDVVKGSAASPDDRLCRYLDLYDERLVTKFSTLSSEEGERVGLNVDTDRGVARYRMLQRIALVQRMPRQLVAVLQQLQQRLTEAAGSSQPMSQRAALESGLKRARDLLVRVAIAADTLLGKGFLGAADEGLTWRYTAFLLTLAELCGRAVPPAYLPVASVPEKEPVLLVVGDV